VHFGTAPSLVVLDNCEHVLEKAAAAGADLVARAPAVHLLATSRAPLAVDGEHVLVLGPLALASSEAADEIAASAAIRLFCDRVRAAGGRVNDSPEQLGALSTLCRRLDGIPLAIELAAARARTLSVAEMLEHLDRRFDLLRRSAPIGTARHASLRAAIDTSYALLSRDEQVFFRALGVFVGSFDARLAHAVAAPEGADRLATIDLLSRLVDHSLVVAEQAGSTMRYRLLESLRRYARERAEDEGGMAEQHERFVAAMLELAGELTLASFERWSSGILGTVLGEFVNLTAAIERCLLTDATPTRAFRMVLPLWGAVHQGRATDVGAVCERVLARWPDAAEPLHAEVLAVAANARLAAEDHASAAELAARALELEATSAVATVVARRTLGMVALRAGDRDAAAEHFARGAELAGAGGMAPFRRELAALVAWTSAAREDDAATLATLDAIARDAAGAGDQIAEVWARITELALLLRRKRWQEAHRVLRVVAALQQRLAYPWFVLCTERSAATLATEESDWWSSRGTWQALLERAAGESDLGELTLALETAAVFAHRAGDTDAARTLAAALPASARGTLLGSPLEDELVELKRSGVIAAPAPGSVWSGEALRRVRRALATEPPPRGAAEESEGTAAVVAPSDDAGRSAPARVTAVSSSLPPARLVRAGDSWSLAYAGREVHVRHVRGLDDLARLVDRPEVELHCLDLMGGGEVGGDAGPVLDEQARRAYRARVNELQAEIDEATEAHDLHRAERAEAELDALVEQLSSAFGLGGRARRTGAATDRARRSPGVSAPRSSASAPFTRSSAATSTTRSARGPGAAIAPSPPSRGR